MPKAQGLGLRLIVLILKYVMMLFQSGKMKMALSELIINGIIHNRDLHIDILSDPRFVSGEYTTDFMENFHRKEK